MNGLKLEVEGVWRRVENNRYLHVAFVLLWESHDRNIYVTKFRAKNAVKLGLCTKANEVENVKKITGSSD